MEENRTSNRIHPLMAGAAISVMLVSVAGVAAITGLIPTSHGKAAPGAGITASNTPAVAAAAASPAALPASEAESKAEPKAPVKPAPAQKTEPRDYTPRTAQNSPSHSRPTYRSTPVAPAPSICESCGRVESVQTVQQQAQASGVGMVAGAVVGGLLGNQVGGGNGRKVATVAGAVGGGYAGNEIEKRTRATTTYHVRVRMDDGRIRTFPYGQQPAWSIGDRVRVVDGQLTSRA